MGVVETTKEFLSIPSRVIESVEVYKSVTVAIGKNYLTLIEAAG
jgi:hypothetical protein